MKKQSINKKDNAEVKVREPPALRSGKVEDGHPASDKKEVIILRKKNV